MEENGCSITGCGCNTTSIYTDKDCPTCGRRLRVAGNLQEIKLNFMCPDCGYHSPQLSMYDVRELVD